MFVLGSNLSQAAPFPTTKSFQLILACPPYDDLNLPAPNPSNLATTLSYHTVFSYSQSTNADLFARLFTCPSIQTNSSSHPQPTKHLLKCTFSKSLTHKQANIKEPYNQDIKAQVNKKDIKKEGRLYMKSPTQGVVCRGCFQIQPPICGVNFKQSINTQGQDQPEENWI